MDENFVKPAVKLAGEDGNAFAIIGRVSKALNRAGYLDKAAEWQDKAMSCESYDHLLNLVFDYADVDADEDENDSGDCPSDDLGYGDGHDETCCN